MRPGHCVNGTDTKWVTVEVRLQSRQMECSISGVDAMVVLDTKYRLLRLQNSINLMRSTVLIALSTSRKECSEHRASTPRNPYGVNFFLVKLFDWTRLNFGVDSGVNSDFGRRDHDENLPWLSNQSASTLFLVLATAI